MPALDTRDIIIIVLLIALGVLALRMLADRLRRKQPPGVPRPPSTPPRILGTDALQADAHFQATVVNTRPPAGKLTPREREVAELAAQGMSNRQIAGELHLSVNTVQNHLRHVFEKLQISSRAELAWWWTQHGDEG